MVAGGSIEFDIGISQSSINSALKSIQSAFDRSGASINNVSITPQGLANIKAQVERALASAQATIPAPRIAAGAAPTVRGSAPAPTSGPANAGRGEEILASLRAQLALEKAISSESDEQAAGLRRQSALINEAVRFKRQLASIRNAGISDQDVKKAEAFARQLTRLNRQRIKIPVDIDSTAAISGARRSGDILTGIFQGVGQQITQLIVQAISSGIQGIIGLGKSSVDAAQDLRGLQISLQTSLGSAEEASKAYNFAASTLDRLGASVETGTRQYTSLTAAAQAAGIEQSLTNDFFSSFTSTLVANGTAAEQQNRAFTAASQIFAKNKLSAEELRQQLAEALPSAIGIVAKGLGEIGLSASGSTEELDKLLESGSISAEQFAQAWIAASGDFKGAVDPINLAISQTGNRFLEFRQAAGEALAPLQVTILDGLSAALGAIGSSAAFDILTEGTENFTASLERSEDSAGSARNLIQTIAEGGARVFADLATEVGQFIERLSPDDLASFGRAFDNTITIIGAGINILGGIATAIAKTGTFLDNLSSDLANAGGAAEFFFGGLLDYAAYVINPLKSIAEVIRNINAAVSGADGVTASNPIGAITDGAEDGLKTMEGVILAVTQGIKTLDDDSARSAKESAAQREAANKAALEAFERDTTNALTAIDKAQADSINRVRQQQLSGAITEEQADAEIAKIEANSQAKIAAKKAEIDAIARLELQGVLTAADASDKRGQAELELSNLIQGELEAKIQIEKDAAEAAKQAAEDARKAAIDRLDAELNASQTIVKARQAELDIADQALSNQNDLIGAQLNLQQSLSELQQNRLENALANAVAEKDINGAQAAAGALAQAKQDAISQEFALKEKQLGIQIEQNKLESQRNILLAEAAAIEARISLAKAQAEGATQAEIDGLNLLIKSADAQVQSARDNAVVNDEINSILQQQLDVDRSLAEEKLNQVDSVNELKKAEEDLAKKQEELAQAQIDNAQKVADARKNAISGLFSAISQEASKSSQEGVAALEAAQKRLQVGRSAGFFQGEEGASGAAATQQALREVQQLVSRGASDEQLASAAFQATQREDGGTAFLEALQLAGRGDIASLAGADDGFTAVTDAIAAGNIILQEIALGLEAARFDREIAAATAQGGPNGIESVAAGSAQSSPSTNIANMNVISPNPVADASQISFDIAVQNAKRSGV